MSCMQRVTPAWAHPDCCIGSENFVLGRNLATVSWKRGTTTLVPGWNRPHGGLERVAHGCVVFLSTRVVSLHWNTIRIRNNTKTEVTNIRNASFELIVRLTFRMLLHTFSEVTVNTKYLPNLPSHHVNAVGRCETRAGASFLIWTPPQSRPASRPSNLPFLLRMPTAGQEERRSKQISLGGASFYPGPRSFSGAAREPRNGDDESRSGFAAFSWIKKSLWDHAA